MIFGLLGDFGNGGVFNGYLFLLNNKEKLCINKFNFWKLGIKVFIIVVCVSDFIFFFVWEFRNFDFFVWILILVKILCCWCLFVNKWLC